MLKMVQKKNLGKSVCGNLSRDIPTEKVIHFHCTQGNLMYWGILYVVHQVRN